VLNPASQRVECRVPLCLPTELEAAVRSASAAFPAWRATPVTQRQRILFSLHSLIRQHEDELVDSIVRENGKTVNDAKGDLFRGLEVVEYAAGVASALQGETIEQLGRGVDTYSYRQPLGVCAGVCPFNFPAMIPLWMWPLAVACGNTFVLKPSERTPTTAIVLARLAAEAGLPPGVLNLVHGQVDTVNFLCDAPEIRAISFVGGNAAGLHIHERGTKNGKKVQSNMGAKVSTRSVRRGLPRTYCFQRLREIVAAVGRSSSEAPEGRVGCQAELHIVLTVRLRVCLWDVRRCSEPRCHLTRR